MKKAKSKAKAKREPESTGKRTRKKAAKKGATKRKDVNPVEARRDITNIVGNELAEITHAVVVEAKKGQLATVKYLFEAAGFYPPATVDGNVDVPEDDTLTRRLLRRLGLPEDALPKMEDDDDAPMKITIPLGKRAEPEEKTNFEGIASRPGNEFVAGSRDSGVAATDLDELDSLADVRKSSSAQEDFGE